MSSRHAVAVLAAWLGSTARLYAQAPDGALKVDVVAVGRDGRPAAGLGPGDFELRERGRAQKVLDVRWVAPADEPRTVVFVVDDLGMSFRSAGFVREALARYVDDQMQPGDRAAIVQTYSTYSNRDTTQAIVSDKKVLHESLSRVHFNPLDRGARTSSYDVRYDVSIRASLECVQAVVRDLSGLPGRKVVVLFSDGIDANLDYFRFVDPMVKAPLAEIVEAANRGSVVIHTVDARGLPGPFTRGWSTAQRQAEHIPLVTLARETGGLFSWNTDVTRALGGILNGEGGYYLVQYRSEAPAGKAHEIAVKVRKPGVKTRTRTEVFAPGDGA